MFVPLGSPVLALCSGVTQPEPFGAREQVKDYVFRSPCYGLLLVYYHALLIVFMIGLKSRILSTFIIATTTIYLN